ncbi:D-glycero-beta-D-manno-heptose 1-phosphate adenylyltransferase [Marinoscillum furvescens]|uniref:D-glycero-beta-D-manno-heptose 1-phosphate adenylyltransferase n=1 Tax=Marinoscillum furvescens DSM 4134 TaxID=1122208 RepID=A0A3D9LGU7_MARFU|nr:D-glycero-beta-D-manno-heptose 1-phosphate adenylyltransferase [Marinoscillum furvescens]REE05848.1 FMN adenylyltransferase [Marinoscillum furvescens DSM 4134]
MNSQQKIHTTDQLINLVADWHHSNKSIVFTNGCFDLLHPGHVECLEKAKNLGDHLIVAVNSDLSVKRLKGASRPITPEDSRARVIAGLQAVDAVVLFDQDTPEKLIQAIKPSVLVKGGDYQLSNIAGAEFVIQSGGKVVTIPLVSDYSSSAIINKLKKTQNQ